MNAAHLHLAINHLPIFALVFALAFLLLGLYRHRADLIRSGLILAVVAGIGAGAAYLTGDPAKDLIRHQPGIERERIHTHEEAAELALWVAGAAAVLALAVWWRNRGRDGESERRGVILVTVLVAIALVLVGRAAWYGGEISHPELRPGFKPVPASVTPERRS